MGKMFKGPKASSIPMPQAPTPLPTRDDEAMRRERMKTYAQRSKRSGRESTNLTTSRLGDAGIADTSSVSTTGSAVLGSK